jgi:uncharacterized metal-binding protein YceD (DUF177 family)
MKGSNMQKNEKIAAQINLIKLPLNAPIEFELDASSEWVKEILVELNENATDKTPEAYLQETTISIYGDVEKKNSTEMGEFLLFRGTVTATYATECVRTLKPMKVDLEVPIKTCFVDESFATSELFAEIDETWVENDVFELYFYNKRTIQFQEMLHEQIFLHYNQYPILDADAKLLGVDWRNPTSKS